MTRPLNSLERLITPAERETYKRLGYVHQLSKDGKRLWKISVEGVALLNPDTKKVYSYLCVDPVGVKGDDWVAALLMAIRWNEPYVLATGNPYSGALTQEDKLIRQNYVKEHEKKEKTP